MEFELSRGGRGGRGERERRGGTTVVRHSRNVGVVTGRCGRQAVGQFRRRPTGRHGREVAGWRRRGAAQDCECGTTKWSGLVVG